MDFVHLVFDRPAMRLRIFGPDAPTDAFEASGDAWGDGLHAPYGHDYPIPPGHYQLTTIDHIDPPIASEGAAQIQVEDLDADALDALIRDAHAMHAPGAVPAANIGGLHGDLGGLARHGRAAIMVHGGGSNAPDPFAPRQQLCKTFGCTRMHNEDLATLVAYLEHHPDRRTVFTVLGDPAPLAR